jgi:hypothetical protein
MNHASLRFGRAALAGFGALAALAALAAPLTQTTAVQTQPDPAAPSFSFLKAGSEPTPAAAGIAEAPPGWMLVSVDGPFTGYVPNQDLTKGLGVKLGASVYLAPQADAGVLTIAAQSDKIALTGLHGKWTQVRVNRPVTGYIHLGALPAAVPGEPAPYAAPAAGPVPGAPVNLSTTSPNAEAGHAAAPTESGKELPRFFEGRLAGFRHSIYSLPHPYPWMLRASDGTRLAYLDISHLLLTNQIASYVGHDVQIFGTVQRVPNSRDIVIVAESLRLK